MIETIPNRLTASRRDSRCHGSDNNLPHNSTPIAYSIAVLNIFTSLRMLTDEATKAWNIR